MLNVERCVRGISGPSSLYGNTFYLGEKSLVREFRDTYPGPRIGSLRKHLVFDSPEHVHVLGHFDVIACHFHDVIKRAMSGFQNNRKPTVKAVLR